MERAEAWTYEVDHHEDHGGSDDYYHVVCGDRYIAEVQTEEEARLIVAAVNKLMAEGIWS